jgi:dTDP-4-dehydrorhamnose reductase
MLGFQYLVPSQSVKALVLGAGGQLGSELMRLLPRAVGLTRAELSVTDQEGLEGALGEHRPEVVFNCAAYNAVDRAEGEPAFARQVNAGGAANAAAACGRHGARFVHFSTNFVFDGLLARPYVETDRPQPLGAYGSSKLEGEHAVLEILPGALVIRTAAVFGDRGSAVKGGSFPQRIVEGAIRHERIRVVSDQRVNPTYANDLAEAAITLARGDMSGVVHVVAEGCCAWDEFARATLARCGIDSEVESVTSVELAAAASRPSNGCLGSRRVDALRPWQDGLAEWAAKRTAGQRESP